MLRSVYIDAAVEAGPGKAEEYAAAVRRVKRRRKILAGFKKLLKFLGL